MKVRWHTMSSTNHSWAHVIQHLAREMDRLGHDINIKSTNNLNIFPDDLKRLLLPGYHGILGANQDSQNSTSDGSVDYMTEDRQIIKVTKDNILSEIPDKKMPYDMDLAYTIFYQAPRRFHPSSKMKALIWNFESSIIPYGWHLYHRAIDYILPSSQFSYDIFANCGVPRDKMVVVPHGVDTNLFNPEIPPFKYKTQKKIKFLHNAIPHARKCHDRILKGYLDAFTGNDDVCLILKTKLIVPSQPFEVDIRQIIEQALKGRNNPPEIEIVSEFVDSIGSLYTGCDCVVSMSSTEGFSLTPLEAIACGATVIAPRQGGQLDFLNDDNSLLVNCGEMIAPQSMQYWHFDPKAIVGDPDTKHFSELLRRTYDNLDYEKNRIKEAARKTTEQFSWKNAAKMILDLPIPKVPSTARLNHPKRKVLYIVPYAMAGGGEVWVREMIKKLDRTIYEPHVAFVHGMTPELKRTFDGVDFTVEDLGEQGKANALKCLIEAENYSLIHFYNSFGIYNLLKECWRQGVRVRIVETVHSDLSWQDAMVKVAKREDLVCAIATVSNTMAKKMIKYGNKNVMTIPHAINWNKFENANRSKDILKEFGVPDGFVVGFVGRLSPEKNIPCVLQCAKNLPQHSFVIVGGGPQEGPLKQMAKELKNVFFVGERQDVEKFYAAFDVLMLSSSMEGLPLVILEAMATGTPIVASNVGAVSELVVDNVNGYTIWNHNDSGLFCAAISKLTDGAAWNQMSVNSRLIAKASRERAEQININILYNKLF